MRKEEIDSNSPSANKNQRQSNEERDIRNRTISQSNCRVRDYKEKKFQEE
ncbi:MAG: hypothetical protein H0X63_08015 [Flavobacteriales bacterium]|nr:hypothetical protein [Flavobacteriales bacterium]